MTNENLQVSSTAADSKRIPFGTRLKSTREAMGLERKDVASQLRLNEKIIVMMEKDRYPVDLPVTFIRGYLRSYAKFLQIPEFEIKKGIEPIKPKMVQTDTAVPIKQLDTITSGNYFMQFFTYLIIFTLVALVGMWCYTHPGQRSTPASENPKVAAATPAENSNLNAAPSDAENASSAVTPDKLSVNDDQQPSTDEEAPGTANSEQAKPVASGKEPAEEAGEGVAEAVAPGSGQESKLAEVKAADKKPGAQTTPANTVDNATTAAKPKTKPAQTAAASSGIAEPAAKPKPAQNTAATATAKPAPSPTVTTASSAVGEVLAGLEDTGDETIQIDQNSGEPLKHTPQRQKHN